jgi:asparagine synthetase B (glutamine-hydrolysing)
MCGILLTNKKINNLEYVIEYLKYRGPDHTSHKIINNYNFIHCLLSMTGEFRPQPFIKEDIICLYNGEIYNYDEFGDYNTDGECLIPLYEKYNSDFIKKLDGEFALILVDFKKDLLIFSTDIFSIKPLWLSIENDKFGISSYESCLKRLNFNNIKQLEPNKTHIYKLSNLEKIEEKTVYDFNLKQYKTDYKDWDNAFKKAIHKRIRNAKHGIFIGLSAGYDSGAIACELNKQNIDFTAYTIMGSENKEIINKRKNIINDHIVINLNKEKFLKSRDTLKKKSEEYLFKIENGEKELYINKLIIKDKLINERNSLIKSVFGEDCDTSNIIENINNILDKEKNIENKKKNKKYWSRRRKLKKIVNINKSIKIKENEMFNTLKRLKYRLCGQYVTDDNGSIGVSHICSLAKSCKKLIYLSGSGADEIISDYGFNGIKHFGHSTIAGKFPKKLEEIFPWKNFFGNTQKAYLMKEEIVTATYGIEGRYPFLDKELIQEFLWLHQDLKNKNYKSVIYNYLKNNSFPFEEGYKTGFNCGFMNVLNNYEKNEIKEKYKKVGQNKRHDLLLDYNNIKIIKEFVKNNEIKFEKLISNTFYKYNINNLEFIVNNM